MKKKLENLTRILLAFAVIITNFSIIPNVYAAPPEPEKGTIIHPINVDENIDTRLVKTVTTNPIDVKNGIFLVTIEAVSIDTILEIEDTTTKYFDYYSSNVGNATVTKNNNGTTTIKFSNLNKTGRVEVSFKIKVNESEMENNKNWYPTNKNAKVIYHALSNHTLTIETTSEVYWKPTPAPVYSSYTVNYLLDGTETKIATSEPFDNVEVGSTVTVSPKDIVGYNKVSDSAKSLEITNNAANNNINFYYTKRTDIPYTVQYRYIENNEEKQVPGLNDDNETGTYLDEVTVNAKAAPDGFKLADGEEVSKGIQLNNVAGNVLTFYYSKRNDLKYNVEYYNETDQNNNEKIKTDEFDNQTYNDEVLLNTINLNKYKTFGYQNGLIVFPTNTDKITIGTGENVIKVCYYKRTDIPYKVQYRYIENNEEKKVPGLDDVDGTGTYLEEVTLNAKAAPKGFVFAGDNNSIKLTLDEENKVVTFYYAKRTDIPYKVQYRYIENNEEKKVPGLDDVDGTGTYLEEVTLNAKAAPDGFVFVGDSNSIKLTLDEENKVVTFYYEMLPHGDQGEPVQPAGPTEPDVNEDGGEIEAPKTGLSDKYFPFGYIIALGTLLVIRKEQED